MALLSANSSLAVSSANVVSENAGTVNCTYHYCTRGIQSPPHGLGTILVLATISTSSSYLTGELSFLHPQLIENPFEFLPLALQDVGYRSVNCTSTHCAVKSQFIVMACELCWDSERACFGRP